MERSDLLPIGRHILLVLCTRMQQGSTLILPGHSPSLTTLAAGTGWDRRTIMRHLAELERLGWLIRQRPDPHLARTQHLRTNYSVVPPGLGAVSTGARGTGSRGLGTVSTGARDTRSPDLGAGDSGARGSAPHSQTPSAHADQSEEALAELVIEQLHERTGVTVTAEWAAGTVAMLLARPGIKNPRAYILRTIAADPSPQKWLPTPQPPDYREEKAG